MARVKKVPLTANNLTKGVKNYIKLRGGWAVRVNTMGVYDPKIDGYRRISDEDKGVSDVVGCYKGRAIFVEVKIGSDSENQYQIRFRREMTRSGAVCIVAHNMEQFVERFNEEVNKNEAE